MARPKALHRRTSEPSRAHKLVRLIAFMPLSVLLLERLWVPFGGTVSEYLHVETIAATKTVKALPASSSASASSSTTPPPFPLERITMSYRIFDPTCPRDTRRIADVVNVHEKEHRTDRRIPKIFHRQAKTRCVTPDLYQLQERWHRALSSGGDQESVGGWSLYFHSDEAVTRLLGMEELYGPFPHLRQLLRNCVQDRDTKSLLWRYLALYVYGGIYADMESAPEGFTGETIRQSDDAFIVMDASGKLSNGFIAASPRHPLIYFALQHALSSLMNAEDVSIGYEIVSFALQRAFEDFLTGHDASTFLEEDYDPTILRSYSGTDNRTVTVIRTYLENSKNGTLYLTETALGTEKLRKDFKKMGMATSEAKHQKGGPSCRLKIFIDVTGASST